MIESSFEDYVERHKSELESVRILLDKELSDNPISLSQQIREVECWAGRISTILAHAEYFLDVNSARLLPSKGNGTDLDRQIKKSELTATHRRFKNIVEGIHRAVSQRVSFGQSLLRFQEHDRNSVKVS